MTDSKDKHRHCCDVPNDNTEMQQMTMARMEAKAWTRVETADAGHWKALHQFKYDAELGRKLA